jgi:hypothetical protein
MTKRSKSNNGNRTDRAIKLKNEIDETMRSLDCLRLLLLGKKMILMDKIDSRVSTIFFQQT